MLHAMGPTFDMQRRKTALAELFGLMQNDMPINQFILKNFRYLPRGLSVIDSLNSFLAIFVLTFELVVKICAAIETSISINVRNFTNVEVTYSAKKTLIVKQTALHLGNDQRPSSPARNSQLPET